MAACYHVVDGFYRQACCRCYTMAGWRPTYPTDPWFEGDIIDNVRIETQDKAAVEAAIVEMSPRMPADARWLLCTSDSCSAEAEAGFRVIRKAQICDGRALLTIVPEYRDAAEASVKALKDAHGDPIRANVMDRSNTGRKHHIVEATPVSPGTILRRPYERVPLARVLSKAFGFSRSFSDAAADDEETKAEDDRPSPAAATASDGVTPS